MYDSKNGISVIICCYNSAARLPKTLEYLFWQQVPSSINWEIIIVDNNSNDDTSQIAEKEWSTYNSTVPFKVVQEPVPGLSNARKRGVKNASYELILFCDDDNWLSPDYLKNAYEIMQQDLNIGVLGGRSEGVFESQPPEWFSHFSFTYALGKQLPQTGIANKRRYLMGAGMVVKKSIMELLFKLSFNNILTDRKGEAVSAGGDTELCLMILFLGYDLYYDEKLFFHHFIPSKRLAQKYCARMLTESYGEMQIYLSFYKIIYKRIKSNKNILFEELYKALLQTIVKATVKDLTVRHLFRIIKSRIVLKRVAMKEIEVRGNLKQLKYMLTKKYQLRKEVEIMAVLVNKLITENRRQHKKYKECFIC